MPNTSGSERGSVCITGMCNGFLESEKQLPVSVDVPYSAAIVGDGVVIACRAFLGVKYGCSRRLGRYPGDGPGKNCIVVKQIEEQLLADQVEGR